MPPRRAARPITQIKRTGDMDVDFVMFENDFLQNKIKATEEATEKNRELADQEIVKRRKTEDKQMQFYADAQDVRAYLSMKHNEKNRKKQYYEKKLQDTRERYKNLLTDLQSKLDKLKQSQDIELTQLTNTLKANKTRRDSLATVAALENQLKREIAEAEQTMKTESKHQGIQMSQAHAEYSDLVGRHEKELKESVMREEAKNRSMTQENLENTVIEMMIEKDAEKTKLTNEVKKSKAIAERNTELMEKNKQLYMNRDLLQSECDSLQKRISKNDATIRTFVDELKAHDQKLKIDAESEEVSDNEEQEKPSAKESPKASVVPELQTSEREANENSKPDREQLLNAFFDDSVNTLCTSIVKILQVIDQPHADEYVQFHEVFNTFEGRKKELRFLMSKLGNLTFENNQKELLPPIGLENIEGVDQEFTKKNLIDPQNKAILEFAGPIGNDEFPELIATQFFQ
ncbi:hypothetical protein TVAG_443590 [Trichomonas vaginalis G3]|uniref:Uncharacterized protein n=1 Tax=Trichomonas vaginalis (strain ATCC PRA-98 / G3) TaxID=412133 RepID=A2ETY3_TRIV3|nr:hypothetical protein TVAGG3_0235490 [Trichomonas vaginalis G3]EAY03871.1 hypothetical protein TVAG_443590 [Trichomonas vaginalis G3]KAI5552960.1 hypothetical protein TVAGG3_0235490 [Trichomonas vaginalis G3]|eukprot:XP_001316094.1 hypothetical protein [Trichomonas vaginalis G3]